METNILEKIGLTKNEISVYISLLELGTTTTGPLTAKSGLHSSRVYESLGKLIDKGLVSFVVKAHRKYFSAADPEAILGLLEREKREVKELIPQLKAIKKEKPMEEKATVYEGYKGVRSVYDAIVGSLGFFLGF